MKPQINSFRYVPVTKDSSSAMNAEGNTGASAGQIASIEASAARAAIDINMEVDDNSDDTPFVQMRSSRITTRMMKIPYQF